MKNTGLNLDGQVQLKSRQEQDDNSTSKKNFSTPHSLTLVNQKSILYWQNKIINRILEYLI
jgi:hypothetical protein